MLGATPAAPVNRTAIWSMTARSRSGAADVATSARRAEGCEGRNRNGGTDRYVLVDDVFRALPKRAASRGRPLTYLEPVRWLARSRSLCSSHARSLSLRRRCCVSRSNSARVLVSTRVYGRPTRRV